MTKLWEHSLEELEYGAVSTVPGTGPYLLTASSDRDNYHDESVELTLRGILKACSLLLQMPLPFRLL